jgi:hypothetical protein
MTRWISHTYGFGTYMHFIEGFLNQETYKKSEEVQKRLLKQAEGFSNRVYIDTIISPSFTSALAQAIQLPGISGKGNNMILFDYVKSDKASLENILGNYTILKAKQLDVCILRSSIKGFGFRKEIHLWLTTSDFRNATLIVLLGYILLGHPDWKDAHIKVLSIYNSKRLKYKQEKIQNMIKSGRLPIAPQNIELIENLDDRPFKDIINERSNEADLSIIGFTDSDIEDQNSSTFESYDNLGTVLFVNASETKDIN